VGGLSASNGGTGGVVNKNIYKFDRNNNEWSFVTEVPIQPNESLNQYPTSFIIENEIFVGTGQIFRKYNFDTKTWTTISPLPVSYIGKVVTGIYNNKAYLTFTKADYSAMALYEYDPVKNGWTEKANPTGRIRNRCNGFVIGSKIYFGLGSAIPNTTALTESERKQFYEYNIETNTWKETTPITSTGLYHFISSSGTATQSNGYLTVYASDDPTGANGTYYYNIWLFDPIKSQWQFKGKIPNGFPGANACVVGSGKEIYFGGGFNSGNAIWRFVE
jgi:N-acetylneuraminic acid mutarotase